MKALKVRIGRLVLTDTGHGSITAAQLELRLRQQLGQTPAPATSAPEAWSEWLRQSLGGGSGRSGNQGDNR